MSTLSSLSVTPSPAIAALKITSPASLIDASPPTPFMVNPGMPGTGSPGLWTVVTITPSRTRAAEQRGPGASFSPL
jgi:hypothetical protein